jgi:pimeloyl-ACP methyl ester carboxylesterase
MTTTNRQAALVLTCVVLPIVYVGAQPPQPQIPRVEWTRPPAQIVDAGEDARWGYLVVPEHRPLTLTGRTIRLPFVILGSRSSTPLPDPVLYTAGGPGDSSLYALRRFRTSPLRDDRNLIILEQRGTRFAEPALICSGIDEALRSGWSGELNGSADPGRMSGAVRSCADSAVAAGVDLTAVLCTALEDSAAIPRIPLLVDAFLRHDVARVAPFVRDYLGSSQGTAWGMRIAVWCNEEWPFMSRARIVRPAGVPDELAGFSQPQIPIDALGVWPAASRPARRENQRVRTNIPTLIVSGEFDPDTPTAWARQVASSLPNAHLIEIAGYSHAPLYRHPAAPRLTREFLAAPTRTPSTSEDLRSRAPFMVSSEQQP